MPAPARADKRFLEKHGNDWRVVVAVPRDLRRSIGKAKLKRPLGTDSLAEANRRKWAVVEELRRELDGARQPYDSLESSLVEAKRFAATRRSLVAAEADTEGLDYEITTRADALAGKPVGEDDEGQPVFAQGRLEAARRFAGVAYGNRTPLDVHRPAYLAQLTVTKRTRADDERAMKYLLAWCKMENLSANLEAFGKREAIRFADALPESVGSSDPRTLNKYVQRLSAFWAWMEGKLYVSDNVWRGRAFRVPRRTVEEEERPFTDAEMVKLLSGSPTPAMQDLMRIAALTGCRLDPIVCLRVRDCVEGVFTFKPQKKEPGARQVPIHSALAEIIARRTTGKEADDSVFPEWPPVKKAGSLRERSFKAGNHFTDYRRAVGVDDRLEGRRRALINFHSFRRWFTTKAEQAGQQPHIIDSVTGHKRPGMALGRYSAGPSLEQKRQCVESVKLPPPFQGGRPRSGG